MIKDYNPKLDLLVAKYTCHDIDIKAWSHLRLKGIYRGDISPQDEYENNLLIVKRCLELIKQQSEFKMDVIDKFNFLLRNNKKYDKEKLIDILKTKDEIEVFYKLLKAKLFGEVNLEISSLIFNYLRMLKNKIPVAIYLKTQEAILDNNLDFVIFKQKINHEILRCLSKNTKHRLVQTEVIKKKLHDNKSRLIKIYGVEKIFLYGSFSYEGATEYSDLDVYIEVKEDLKKDIYHKNKIFKFLSKILGLPVDGHVNDVEFDFDSSFNHDIKKHLKQIL